jgi:dipeptidyl aminopeptidase/acylaminoacyl peptidase
MALRPWRTTEEKPAPHRRKAPSRDDTLSDELCIELLSSCSKLPDRRRHSAIHSTISPIKHADAINVPVLLIHGRDDVVVPFEQSQVMLDAMKSAKKDVEMVTLKREDHWLSRSETRLQMLQGSVQFLRVHNPPD